MVLPASLRDEALVDRGARLLYRPLKQKSLEAAARAQVARMLRHHLAGCARSLARSPVISPSSPLISPHGQLHLPRRYATSLAEDEAALRACCGEAAEGGALPGASGGAAEAAAASGGAAAEAALRLLCFEKRLLTAALSELSEAPAAA